MEGSDGFDTRAFSAENMGLLLFRDCTFSVNKREEKTKEKNLGVLSEPCTQFVSLPATIIPRWTIGKIVIPVIIQNPTSDLRM